jgi:hypothetical protein
VTVDGEPAPLMVDEAGRVSVALEAGEHTVVVK